MSKKKIVVCGLGYAGLSFIRNFENLNNIEIVAIDQNPFHYLQPAVYKYISNEKLLNEIIIDLFYLTKHIRKNLVFYKDKIVNIDFNKRYVITYNHTVKYDYLILSLGSQTYFPNIEGLKKYSAGIKNVGRAMEFKHSFEKIIFNKMKEEKDGCINRDFNIVIGGGGLSGVEIATEMAVFQKKILSNIGCSIGKAGIYIVEALPNILYGMDDFIIETANERIKKLDINLIVGKRIVKVEANKIVLEDGNEIKTDFLIWTGGIIGNNLLSKLDLPKNKKNQLLVDEYFRVKSLDNVFAIGDCAEIKDFDTGKILPSTAQVAIQCGKIVAKHIKNLIERKKLEKLSPKVKGILTALGGKYAVGIIGKNVRIKGYPAHILKELILNSYKYSLKFNI